MIHTAPAWLAVAFGVFASPSELLGEFASARRGDRAEPPIALVASVKAKNDGFFLNFELVSLADEPICIDEDSLPWSNAYSVSLLALDKSGTVIPLVYPIDDPNFLGQCVNIEPGASLGGWFPLSSRLPDLSKRLKAGPVVVVWRYAGRLSGVVTVPGAEGES